MDNTSPRYYYWERGDRTSLTTNFKAREFDCHCGTCNDQKISIDLVDKLDALKVACGFPIIITSGYRCKAYQAQLRRNGYETSAGVSQHELGNAADIKRYHVDGFVEATKSLFKAVGVANTFLHVDIRDDKIRAWDYKSR